MKRRILYYNSIICEIFLLMQSTWIFKLYEDQIKSPDTYSNWPVLEIPLNFQLKSPYPLDNFFIPKAWLWFSLYAELVH